MLQQSHVLTCHECRATAATVESLITSKAIDKSDYRGGSCIHPACLEASLSQSLAALHLKTVQISLIRPPTPRTVSP